VFHVQQFPVGLSEAWVFHVKQRLEKRV
jgi:hypothetical protein